MRPRTPLPVPLQGRIFRVRTAIGNGTTEKRLRGRDLDRPFHGVRADGPVRSLRNRCISLTAVMAEHQVFSHTTAAQLWRMPLPTSVDKDELHVTALGARGRIRRAGVVGWERQDADLERYHVADLPVLGPADTWCSLSVVLTREWLVAVGDFLLSGERSDRGRELPLCTTEDLDEAVHRHGARRGAAALRWALERLRCPVDSPRESLLRLALVAGGLPEPEVQLAVATAGGTLHGDLGYRAARLLLEYQGDEHRRSRKRWLQDLTRIQLLEDAGYRVILIGADDLRDGASALIARIRRHLRVAD